MLTLSSRGRAGGRAAPGHRGLEHERAQKTRPGDPSHSRPSTLVTCCSACSARVLVAHRSIMWHFAVRRQQPQHLCRDGLAELAGAAVAGVPVATQPRRRRHPFQAGRMLPLPCVSAASVAETLPLPCVSAASVAETLPLRTVQAFIRGYNLTGALSL